MSSTGRIPKFHEQVEGTGVGSPRGAAKGCKGYGIQTQRQLPRLVIAHSAHSQPGTQFNERVSQASKVLFIGCRNAVDVSRCALGPMDTCRHPTDKHIVDAVSVQDSQDAIRIISGVRRIRVYAGAYAERARSRLARNSRTLAAESSGSPASVVGRSSGVGGSLPTRSRALAQCFTAAASFTVLMVLPHPTVWASLGSP